MGVLEIQGPVELQDTIPAISNLDIDTIDLAEGHDVHWQVFLEIPGKKMIFEVLAVEHSLVVTWTIYGIIKPSGIIDHAIDIISDGINMFFNVINNELVDLDVKLIRFS